MKALKVLKINNHGELRSVRKRLYVKYMLSLRCENIAKSELKKMGFRFIISDNAIEFLEGVTQVQLDALKANLKKSGLVLLDESESLLIDRIITSINDTMHDTVQLPHISYDELINKNLIFESDKILRIFSEIKGISIIQYIILQKIEKVKELLLYSDLSLSEIAWQLSYKNEDFLIAQFKKFTGLLPVYFREIKLKREGKFSLK